jgi:hypothetical protein
MLFVRGRFRILPGRRKPGARVRKLDNFHGSLDESGRAMLDTILEGVQTGDTGGYAVKKARYEDPTADNSGSEPSSGWNDLIGWIEEQGEDDTQGFLRRKG